MLLAGAHEDVGEAQPHPRVPPALAEVRLQHLDGALVGERVVQRDGADRRRLGAARPPDVRLLEDVAHAGMRARDAVQRRLVELEDVGDRGGDDGGRARAAGEAGDLAEEVASAELGHGVVPARGVADEDLDPAAGEDEEALAGLALGDDHVPGGEGVHAQAAHHRQQLLLGEVGEQRHGEQAMRVLDDARALDGGAGRRRPLEHVLHDVEEVVLVGLLGHLRGERWSGGLGLGLGVGLQDDFELIGRRFERAALRRRRRRINGDGVFRQLDRGCRGGAFGARSAARWRLRAVPAARRGTA